MAKKKKKREGNGRKKKKEIQVIFKNHFPPRSHTWRGVRGKPREDPKLLLGTRLLWGFCFSQLGDSPFPSDASAAALGEHPETLLSGLPWVGVFLA